MTPEERKKPGVTMSYVAAGLEMDLAHPAFKSGFREMRGETIS